MIYGYCRCSTQKQKESRQIENILRDKCRLSGKIITYEMPAETAYEIDEESDWIIVEELMKK